MCQLQANALSAQDSVEITLSERASEDTVYSRVSSPSNVSLGHPQMQRNVMQQDCFVSLNLNLHECMKVEIHVLKLHCLSLKV